MLLIEQIYMFIRNSNFHEKEYNPYFVNIELYK